jgi:hypothetical protein
MSRALPVFAAVALVAGCGNNFDPASRIASVRILAARADRPYARPGDSVQVDLLAVDGRADRSRPMALFWIPAPCINPPDDAYYACYPSFEALFARGVDLTSALAAGPAFSFPIPADALEAGAAFGSAVVFAMACAGHVQYVGQRGPSPLGVPFACFDDGGAELGPDTFVFAYARIFVSAALTNANPVIDALTFDGQRVQPGAGITLDNCPAAPCPGTPIDVVVPADSQEIDPTNVAVDGTVAREGIWVDYYLTGGKVKYDVRVLYDAAAGRVPSAVDLEAPAAPGEHELWAVVHDNRGGVAWLEVPIHVR